METMENNGSETRDGRLERKVKKPRLSIVRFPYTLFLSSFSFFFFFFLLQLTHEIITIQINVNPTIFHRVTL